MIFFKHVSDDRKEKYSDKWERRPGRVFLQFNKKNGLRFKYIKLPQENGSTFGEQ